jgi:hypothetical protein
MKGFFNFTAFLRYLCLTILSYILCNIQAQQSNTLFFMHSLPEANYINPAVQIECKYFLGLPVISSFHGNLASNVFSVREVLFNDPRGGYDVDLTYNTGKLDKQNYFLTEVHATLLALGLRLEKTYYTFTITEKNNLSILYTHDLGYFYRRGNAEFEGQWMDLKATGAFFNHVREYAFGISKAYASKLKLGGKAKLLFGKLNLATGNSHLSMYTEEGSNHLLFDIDGGFNSSMPQSMHIEDTVGYRFYERYDASVASYLMNRQNPGIAFDFGFTYPYNDRLTLSGSLLDLGIIYYRSNLTNYSLQGNYLYQGDYGEHPSSTTLFWELFDELNENMTEELSYNSYFYFLDPRLYLGATYKINNKYDLNFLLYNRFFPNHIQTGATLSILTRPLKDLETSVSWSYMNKSIMNLGLGIGYGKSPLQIYLVSDNIFGIFLPTTLKNVNLRVGLNLNFGCRSEFNIDQCGCAWLRDAEERGLRKDKLKHGKNVKGN